MAIDSGSEANSRQGRPAAGDRGAAAAGSTRDRRCQTLLGITGSGKTFTIANVIQTIGQADADHRAEQDAGRPALRRDARSVPGQRRPLLRQLLRLLPARSVHPGDRHLHREGRDHQRPDRSHAPRGHPRAAVATGRHHRRQRELHLRHRLRGDLRRACSSRSNKGEELRRDDLLRRLVDIQYERNDVDFHRGTFRVRGDVVEIFPAYEEERRDPRRVLRRRGGRHQRGRSAARSRARLARPLRGLPGLALRDAAAAAAARHRGHPRGAPRAARLLRQARALPREAAHSSSARSTTWRCSSRWASCRASRTTRGTCRTASPGEPPPTLIDYFPDDFLLILDESHQTVPQVGAMYRGDRSRKETLVEYGFRLPSALDNRPLQVRGVREVHATRRSSCRRRPGDYELEQQRRRSRRAADPPDRADRPGDLRAPGRRAGRRPAGRDPEARREATSACWSPR